MVNIDILVNRIKFFYDSSHMFASVVIIALYEVNEVGRFLSAACVHTFASGLPVLVNEDFVAKPPEGLGAYYKEGFAVYYINQRYLQV